MPTPAQIYPIGIMHARVQTSLFMHARVFWVMVTLDMILCPVGVFLYARVHLVIQFCVLYLKVIVVFLHAHVHPVIQYFGTVQPYESHWYTMWYKEFTKIGVLREETVDHCTVQTCSLMYIIWSSSALHFHSQPYNAVRWRVLVLESAYSCIFSHSMGSTHIQSYPWQQHMNVHASAGIACLHKPLSPCQHPYEHTILFLQSDKCL
jgi:hypothetical protein